MSTFATAWAWEQQIDRAEDKLVLLRMADSTQHDGWWRGDIMRLAAPCGLSEDQVEASVERLVGSGVLFGESGAYRLL